MGREGGGIMDSQTWVIKQTDIQLHAACPLRVTKSKAKKDSQTSMHAHDFYEVVLCASGRYIEMTKTGQRKMDAGSVIIMLPGEEHSPLITAESEIYMANFTMDLFGDELTDFLKQPGMMELFFYHFLVKGEDSIPCFLLSDAGLQKCIALFEQLLHPPALLADSSLLLYRKNLFANIMLLLAAEYVAQQPEYVEVSNSGRLITALITVESFLDLESKAIVQSIYSRLDVSKAYLFSYFKKHMGTTLLEYINHRKIVKSCTLLRTDLDITEVAMKLGFYDGAHYSRLFKRYMDITPSDYRKRYVDGDEVLL